MLYPSLSPVGGEWHRYMASGASIYQEPFGRNFATSSQHPHVSCQLPCFKLNRLQSLTAGTVMVLTTPDANRTMLSYLGTQHEVGIDGALEAAISSARVLLIEGYLWEVSRAPLSDQMS